MRSAARTIPWLAAASLGFSAPDAATPKRPVTDTYWGVDVAEDYRYLEDPSDAETQRFAAQQNQRTRQWLDSRPERPAILKRVTELTHDDSPDFFGLQFAGGRVFAIKRQPPREQPMLVVFPPGGQLSGERAVVDPNVIDPSGSTSIDFYVPSLDGSRVAVSLSIGGTETGTLSVYEVETGRTLPDSIPRVNGGTAGGSAAWSPDGNGLYYTRYPRAGERPEEDLPFYTQIWYHALGTPESQDGYVLGREFPRIAEIELSTSPDGRYVLAQVENGDGGEFQYWLKGPDLDWTLVADFKDLVIHAEPGPDGKLYMLSRNGAPHMKVLRVPCADPLLGKAEVVIPEGQAVIRSFLPAATRLYAIEMIGGPTTLRVLDLVAKTSTVLGAEEPATLSDLVRLEGDAILLRRQSYLSPPAVLRYAPGMQALEPTPLVHRSKADFGNCTVRREMASAADGTRIPITLLMRKDLKVDGKAPLVLYGYGSYGISLGPYFSAQLLLWLEQGGIYAVANVRGGGEFGDVWHRAANLENKRVTIDDFASAARHLVESRYTSRERLAIEGRSAGGFLIYATVVHYPQLCKAAVAHVGIGDMLRVEKSPNGQFNVTEFGTVEEERLFHAMYALSPYHNVHDGTVYPSMFITTGLNDPRVEPWQSFKMVARLQASGTPNPVLLRVSEKTGHGGGTGLSERDQLLADTWTFLFSALNTPYRQAGQ